MGGSVKISRSTFMLVYIHAGLIILAHIIFLHMIRKAVSRSSWLGENIKVYIHAGLCAFELGCVCLEQGVLMQTAGMGVWAFSLFLVVIWHIIGLEDKSPNPLPHMLEGSDLCPHHAGLQSAKL